MSERRRAALKQKRIRQVRRQIAMICVGFAAVVVAIGIYVVKTGEAKKEAAKQSVEKQVTENKPENSATTETADKMEESLDKTSEETPEERLERVKQEATQAGYPEKVIKLLSKNPETVDFVENYGEKKEIASPTVIEELKEGEIPRLIQWDERWGYAPYGTDIIAVCGCGPTTLSMVVAGLTGDNTLTPVKLAQYGTEHNYVTEKNDTSWSFMTEACEEWGVKCKEGIVDKASVLKELDAGHPIVCSVGPGDFTQTGHFILLAGYDEDGLIVHDPFSIVNSEKRWEFDDIKDQIKVMWIYSK